MPVTDRVLLVESDSSRHLGLFEDLDSVDTVDRVVFPHHVNVARKVLTRISPEAAWGLCALESGIGKRQYKRAVIVDTALNRMSRRAFDSIAVRSGEVAVMLINSLDASSPSVAGIKRKLSWVRSGAVYSFDAKDVAVYGYYPLGLRYYSARHVTHSFSQDWDCYFVGGMKGNREQLIRDCYKAFEGAGVRALFECTRMKGESCADDGSGIVWLGNTWSPYTDILANVARSGCVVEILQEGQHAQSLRYFEAVSQNKKLLTTNERVVNLPFYDPRYMKVFRSVSDIDMGWMKDPEMPEYGYEGEFSPRGSELFI